MLLLLVPSREQTGYRASRVEKHDGSGACSYESQTSQSRLHATPVPYFFLADQSRGFGPLQARNGLSCFLTSAGEIAAVLQPQPGCEMTWYSVSCLHAANDEVV